MTKWQLDRDGGPWDYPSLGFTATDGAIIDGTLSNPVMTTAPDAFWTEYLGASAETGVTRWGEFVHPPVPAEPTSGSILIYDATSNRWAPTTATDAVNPSTELGAAYSAVLLDVDGDPASAFRVQQDARLAATYATVLTAEGGDESATISTFLAAASPLGVKRLVGSFTVGSTVAVPAGVYVDMSAAEIVSTLSATSALTVAANATIQGGSIESPAAWDGANVEWTYAVVHVQGSGVTIDGLTLTNIHKIGIGFDGVNDGIVSNCRIVGNYPSASWTGVETAHVGIAIDPSGTGEDGSFVITGNSVKSCVQGVFIGNYGTASNALGITISGNSMHGCWNHGVYGSTGASGVAVTGNAFNRCQVSVALTGSYHTVTGNTMVTTSTGDQRDIAGISLRDPFGCVVAHNTIKGEMTTGNAVISLAELGGTSVKDNVVAQNVIDVAAVESHAIRIGAGGVGVFTENNIVQGNRIRRASKATSGAIAVFGAAGAVGVGNQVLDNEIVLTADSYGIHATFQTGLAVRGNIVRVEYDSGAAYTLPCVALNTVTDALVASNDLSISAAWGTNISIRGVWEISACVTNRIGANRYRFSATKTAARIEMVLGSTSGSVIDEAGAGAPNVNAGVGSIWRRTDGAAATTLYVKESGTGATGWVGK